MSLDKFSTPYDDIILSLLEPTSKAYIVGGYIRDKILDIDTLDIDYVITNQNATHIAEKFANQINGHYINLDSENQIARVVLQDKITSIDFASCMGDDIHKDLQRRDFTINALGYDIQTKELIDITNGLNDIKTGTISLISEQNILDDPLRILRAYRFSSKYDFKIDENTQKILKKYPNLMQKSAIAKERILQETLKLFEGENSYKTIQKMEDTGLLYEIFEPLKETTKIPPNTHHHLCLIEHSIESLRQLELSLKDEPEWVQNHLKSTPNRLSLLKIATLLHDIGKPCCWTIEGDRHRFIKHDSIGAQLAKEALKPLKYSKNQIKYIHNLIKNHIYPSQLLQTDTTKKAIMKMFRKLEDTTVDTILLAKADRKSACGPAITKKIIEENISGLNNLLEEYKNTQEELKPLPKLLSGDEIINLLQIPANKQLGEIIKNLNEEQISGEITTKEEAIDWLLQNYKKAPQQAQ